MKPTVHYKRRLPALGLRAGDVCMLTPMAVADRELLLHFSHDYSTFVDCSTPGKPLIDLRTRA